MSSCTEANVVGSRRSYEASLGAEPLSVMPHRCALLRKAKAAGFREVERDGATHEYRYEKVDTATDLLDLTSRTIKMAQRIRLSGSPLLAIQGDGSQVQNLHTFTIDVRYIDIKTNVTHTEFLELVNCNGDARSMVDAILDALGADLMVKLVGGSFDVSQPKTEPKSEVGLRCESTPVDTLGVAGRQLNVWRDQWRRSVAKGLRTVRAVHPLRRPPPRPCLEACLGGRGRPNRGHRRRRLFEALWPDQQIRCSRKETASLAGRVYRAAEWFHPARRHAMAVKRRGG